MNKKVLIIGGGVVVLGAIGYLYFTNKKKQDVLLSGGAGSTSTTPTTGVGSNPINNEIPPLSTGGISPKSNLNSELSPLSVNYGQSEINLEKAQDIVKKMLKGKKWNEVKSSTLKSINTKLNKLDFQYKNGVLLKL